MRTINAGCAAVAPYLVRAAIAEVLREHAMLPAKAVMHLSQRASWENCSTVTLGFGSHMFTSDSVCTMAGVPIVEDIREPVDRIQFKDANDILLSEIVNLAIPQGFEHERGANGAPK